MQYKINQVPDNALMFSCVFCGSPVEKTTKFCQQCEKQEDWMLDWEDFRQDAVEQANKIGWRYSENYGVLCDQCSAKKSSLALLGENATPGYDGWDQPIELECDVCGATLEFYPKPRAK